MSEVFAVQLALACLLVILHVITDGDMGKNADKLTLSVPLEHQQIHITQPHMARLREIKNDYVKASKLGEFILK